MTPPIRLNIPHATVARKSVECRIDEAVHDQADEVQAAIQEAIICGRMAVGGNGHLYPLVKQVLEEAGYECVNSSQYNESLWSVSWEKAI